MHSAVLPGGDKEKTRDFRPVFYTLKTNCQP